MNNVTSNKVSLADKLKGKVGTPIADQSAMNKADLTVNKFAEVESLRQTIPASTSKTAWPKSLSSG